MKIVRWLLQLDDLVPFEVTPRRARLPRALALLLLIATFPDVSIEFQAERLRPVIDWHGRAHHGRHGGAFLRAAAVDETGYLMVGEMRGGAVLLLLGVRPVA